MSRYGRFHVAEPPSALASLHLHSGAPLKPVDWEPKNAVLDQQDLLNQGIFCSHFIAGAQDVDALGSCTANATMSALSLALDERAYLAYTGANSYDDSATIEEAAIRFYHVCTDQTGQADQEWPPTDCGSSGPYIVQECVAQHLVSGQRVASGAENIASLLQTGGILQGTPFFNAWEEPDAHGFVDGDGTADDLERAVSSGVAGGHETFICAIESISFDLVGRVNAAQTVLRVRNSWGRSWGDNGDFRIHLSTLDYIGHYADFRQLVPVA